MDNSETSLKPNGETVAISPRESTMSDLGATSALQDALAVEGGGGGGGGGRERGYKTRREKEEKEEEEEEESTFSDSSSEVDEHRLLSVNCGSNMSTTSARHRQEQATRVKLTQESWSDEEIDPFSFYPPLTKWDYLKVCINSLWLLPLRLIFVVVPSVVMGIIVCTLAVACDRFDEDDPQPLNRWGRFILNYIGKIASRIFLFGFGFNWIKTRGQPAPTKEAPVLIVSPHSSMLDMFIISLYKVPTYVARANVRDIPIFGKLITKTLRTIYVERENPDSRMKAAEEIRRRTHTRGEWPKVLIFPEGTTTNRRALISFKQGAFLPKLPVQPVLLKFGNETNTSWSDDKYGLIKSLCLTLCQFHNALEVEFLPVYYPMDEEMNDTKLYARNVQVLMARTLGVPYTQHALEDVLLMRCAVQTGLSAKSGIVIYRMVTQDLNMDLRSLKKWLHRFAAIDFDKDGFINVVDLARFLHLPSDACVQAAFTVADKSGDQKLSFRNYLYGVVGRARHLLEDVNFLQSIFSFFDKDGDGTVTQADIARHFAIGSIVCNAAKSRQEERQQPFERLGSDVSYQNCEWTLPDEMNIEQLSSVLACHPEYVLVFHECQQIGFCCSTLSGSSSLGSRSRSRAVLPPTSATVTGVGITNGHGLTQNGYHKTCSKR